MAMIRVGMGETGVASTGEPTAVDKFIGGAKVWLNPGYITTEMSALWAGLKADAIGTLTNPRALGFLLVPAAILAMVLGMKSARARRARNPRRRVARRNPRRRVAAGSVRRTKKRNPKTGRHRWSLLKEMTHAERGWPRGMRKTKSRTASRKPGKRSRSRGTHRVKNGRSYVVRGQRPMLSYTPGPGKVFYLEGRKGVVKSVVPDERGIQYVWFRRAVGGTIGMSLGNFRQAAYIA